MSKCCFITNTHSKNESMWEPHFRELDKWFHSAKKYVFSDKIVPTDNLYDCFYLYETEDSFREQYRKGLGWVEEEFCLTLNEDYLLYDKPDIVALDKICHFLETNPEFSFVRLMKGIDNFPEHKVHNDPPLYYLNPANPYFYSQTASIWRTKDLIKVHEMEGDYDIGGLDMSKQFEVVAADRLRDLNMQGAYYYNGEPKRGMYHYDSKIFPHTASALVKGKLNYAEYKEELERLL